MKKGEGNEKGKGEWKYVFVSVEKINLIGYYRIRAIYLS